MAINLMGLWGVGTGGSPQQFLAYPPAVLMTPVTITTKSMPAYLGSYIEDSYGTLPDGRVLRTKRITENQGETHNYSKIQPWNCDMSFCITGEGIKASLRNGRTFELIRNIQPTGINFQWSRTNPNVFYYLTNLILTKVTLSNGGNTVTRTTLRDFRDFGTITYAQLGPSEGQFDKTDTYCAVNITVNGVPSVYIYNILTNTVDYQKTHSQIGSILMRPLAGTDKVDFVTVTEWGEVAIKIDRDAQDDEVAILNLGMTSKLTQINTPSHPDFGYGIDGTTRLVSRAASIGYFNRETGVNTTPFNQTERTALGFEGTACHTSFKCYQDPGWALYSTAKQVTGGTTKNELFAMKLDGSNVCRRFGFRRTIARDLAETKPEGYYVNEPHGVISPDGTMAMWKGIFDDPINNPDFISHSYVSGVGIV